MIGGVMGMKGLSADDRIILIRVKIERAKTNLSNLESELIAYGTRHFHAATSHRDPQTGEVVVHGPQQWRKFPFDALAAAGDVIQNLRTALDYLAQQLVWAGSGEEPSRLVQFPIAKDAAAYESSKSTRVEGMCPKAIKFIDSLKPYKGGNDALWKIHELNNIDKHRTLFTYAEDCFLTADWLPGNWPFNLKASNPNFAGAFDADVEKDMEFELEKALSDPQILEGNSLLPSLHQLINFVDNLILSFRPFL
jgi:hypothetical protein